MQPLNVGLRRTALYLDINLRYGTIFFRIDPILNSLQGTIFKEDMSRYMT